VYKQATRTKQSHFYELFDEMGVWLEQRSLKEDVPHDIRYREMQQLIELWIETLPVKRKEIFILYYREQLTTQEIAERLNLSQKTVQNQLGLAFNDLRGKLPDVAAVFVIAYLIH
jgi:RNA polymerase sigma-70 factor (ECF subfamily)